MLNEPHPPSPGQPHDPAQGPASHHGHDHPNQPGQPGFGGKKRRRRRRGKNKNPGTPPPHGQHPAPHTGHHDQAHPPMHAVPAAPTQPAVPQRQYHGVGIPGFNPDTAPLIRRFDDVTTIDPQPRLTLEYRGCPESCRLIDLFCPIGRGQRALIVSPPKAGKTTLLKDIAGAIARNHPEVILLALLIDERPEEVTDFRRTFAAYPPHADGTPRGHVLASSNDHSNDKHIHLAIGAMELGKRLVEAGKHVVIVLDSLTRLGRAFNLSRKHASSGRTLSGGLDAKALEVPRQIFGSARNTEDAGSLTIIATCLIDTGSQGDQVIFEEFKGSGNMELILDRKIAERRLFPAINLAASGTRKENLLMGDQEYKTVTALRRRLIAMPPHVQVEQLLAALKRFADNATLVGSAGG